MSDTRGRLDRAIDGAVRQLMTVDPAPDLRRRITDRLAEPARRAWLVPAMAAAAVAVVVIATVLLQPQAPQPVPEPSIARSQAQPAGSAPEPQPAAATPQSGSRVAPEPGPRPLGPVARTAPAAPLQTPAPPDIFGPRTDRVSAANVHPEDSGVPVDAAQGPVTGVPDLEPIDPIAIPPLVIEPIVVSPVIVSVLPPTR